MVGNHHYFLIIKNKFRRKRLTGIVERRVGWINASRIQAESAIFGIGYRSGGISLSAFRQLHAFSVVDKSGTDIPARCTAVHVIDRSNIGKSIGWTALLLDGINQHFVAARSINGSGVVSAVIVLNLQKADNIWCFQVGHDCLGDIADFLGTAFFREVLHIKGSNRQLVCSGFQRGRLPLD
ncbi:hypothetical protein D3C75_972120 [compost metagenome]